MNEHVLVYITAPSEQEANTLTSALLEQRLIACANIHGPVTSLYRWEGQRQEASEWVIIGKTQGKHQQQVTDFVTGHHSYDCPCVLFTPISGGFRPFLDWVTAETTSEKEH